MNIIIIKRIMFEKKTTLQLLRNQNWKTVKTETEKINKLTHIFMNNIMELNKLIYAGVKLVCDKIDISSKEYEQKLKTWKSN